VCISIPQLCSCDFCKLKCKCIGSCLKNAVSTIFCKVPKRIGACICDGSKKCGKCTVQCCSKTCKSISNCPKNCKIGCNKCCEKHYKCSKKNIDNVWACCNKKCRRGCLTCHVCNCVKKQKKEDKIKSDPQLKVKLSDAELKYFIEENLLVFR